MRLATKATHQQTRAFNQGLVLRTIYDLGPISRAEIARVTGPHPHQRQRAGRRRDRRGPRPGGRPRAVERRQGPDPAPGRRGRPRRDRPRPRRARFAGALVDLRGEIRATDRGARRGPRRRGGARRASSGLVDELVAEAPAGRLLGIGVGTPGLVDTATGDDPLGGQPRLAGPPARPDPHRAHRAPGLRRQRLARRGPGRVPVRRRPPARPTSSRSRSATASAPGSSSAASSSRATASGPARSATRRSSTTASSAAAAGSAASRPWRARGRSSRRRSRWRPSTPTGELARRLAAADDPSIDDVAAALAAGDEDARRIAVAAGRWLGRAVAALIGTLDIRHVVLLGCVTAPRRAVARRGPRRGRRGGRSACSPDETRIEVGGAAENVVLLGASALLMTRELGLVPAR